MEWRRVFGVYVGTVQYAEREQGCVIGCYCMCQPASLPACLPAWSALASSKSAVGAACTHDCRKSPIDLIILRLLLTHDYILTYLRSLPSELIDVEILSVTYCKHTFLTTPDLR